MTFTGTRLQNRAKGKLNSHPENVRYNLPLLKNMYQKAIPRYVADRQTDKQKSLKHNATFIRGLSSTRLVWYCNHIWPSPYQADYVKRVQALHTSISCWMKCRLKNWLFRNTCLYPKWHTHLTSRDTVTRTPYQSWHSDTPTLPVVTQWHAHQSHLSQHSNSDIHRAPALVHGATTQ